jgi:hypothetical protein
LQGFLNETGKEWMLHASALIWKQTNKKTLWLLVRKRTIPTERPPLVGEI